MTDWKDHILADPDVLGGRPVIKGTRLSVDFLLGLLAQGSTNQQLFDSHSGLSPEAMCAMFAYVRESMAAFGFLSRGSREVTL